MTAHDHDPTSDARGDCLFCTFAAEPGKRAFHENDLAFAMWDAFPVSPGHALAIPRRHVAGWFEATAEERSALLDAIDVAKGLVEQDHSPDGWNVGINVGRAAGQTVFHLHVHLIPRYAGDVDDPRGGVRGVIPDRGQY